MRILVSGSTATVRNVGKRCPDYCGHLLTPDAGNSVAATLKTGLAWAVDNAAFSGFDPVAFRRLLRRVAGKPGLLWIACPDVVADAQATLSRFEEWREEVSAAGPIAYVAQDGSETCPVPWPFIDCLFIGGSTKWKLSQCAADLAREAKEEGLLVHMGHVNSLRRLQAAYDMGCDSVDGSGYSRFAGTHLERHIRFLQSLEPQPVLFG